MSSNSTPSSKTFLYAGRLSPEKGPDILIKAWKHLPFLNATLEIAGSGPMLSELQELAQNAANPIHFLGHLDRASLSKHMQQATAVIFPSRLYETFGLSAFEANALGTPVILSDCIVTASHIQPRQTGLLFRANNTRDLADQITSMIQKPFRVSTPIPTDITPSGNLALLLNLYESLLPKNS